MEHGFAENEIEQSGIVRLDDEEKDLFERYVQQLWPDYYVFRVAPDVVANEVRVPWYRRDHCDLGLS